MEKTRTIRYIRQSFYFHVASQFNMYDVLLEELSFFAAGSKLNRLFCRHLTRATVI